MSDEDQPMSDGHITTTSSSSLSEDVSDPAYAEEEEQEDEQQTASKSTRSTRSSAPLDESAKQEVVSRAEKLLSELLEKTNRVLLKTSAIGQVDSSKEVKKPASSSRGRKAAGGRKTEREEDQELLDDLKHVVEQDEEDIPLQLLSQPTIVTGNMRPYQLEGLNWMIRLYHAGVSGILADEMGLGKTLQSISLLAYLRQYVGVKGPHLVLVPLTTLGNWEREFARWCPSIRVFKFHGMKEERAEMIRQGQLTNGEFDVLLTSYEMANREKSQIGKNKFHYIVVDEAHRLKNENSLLSQVVRSFSSKCRLLLTGTPLQNNLHELWALLNFLLPEVFASAEDFDDMFKAAENDPHVSENLLKKLSMILRPFMLRRLKAQVATDLPPKKISCLYVGMSELQRKLYRGILEKDIDAVVGPCKERGRLMNMIMQLRKAANHPYLFEGVEDRTLPPYGDHLVTTSGKMCVLDKLLFRLQRDGSRVLIFSQMTRTIDILEDYCIFRGFQYCRIDGSTSQEAREQYMKDFNQEGSEKFVFLLSTRAGGLGINLNTADIVIFYDSDWNPQMDLQAQDRAHRIGQKKPVFVYRLVTESTIEEKILERAENKLRLDAMVVQQGRMAKASTGMSTEEAQSMIKYGAEKIFRQQGATITDEDIDHILSKGEKRTADLNEKIGKHVGLMDLTLDGTAPSLLLPDEDQDLQLPEGMDKDSLLKMSIYDNMGKRERKKNYNENEYYREMLKSGESRLKSSIPRPYTIPKMKWFQFYQQDRIRELSEKEQEFFQRHQYDINPPAQRGITAAEEQELQTLLKEGFADWNWHDYHSFLEACIRYGRDRHDRIVKSMESRKSKESVLSYHEAFFTKASDYRVGLAALKKINKGEARQQKFAEFEDILERVLSGYSNRQEILDKLPVKVGHAHKNKGYTSLEDRLLLYWCRELGYGEWKKLASRMKKEEELRFDYFIKSRTVSDLQKRVDALIRGLQKHSKEDPTKYKLPKTSKLAESASSASTSSSTSTSSTLSSSSSNIIKLTLSRPTLSLGSSASAPAQSMNITASTIPSLPSSHSNPSSLPSSNSVAVPRTLTPMAEDSGDDDDSDDEDDIPLAQRRKGLVA